MIWVLVGVLVAMVIGVAVLGRAPTSVLPGAGTIVRSEDFADRWPFTVPAGRVDCHNGAVVFTAPDNTVYALNGSAKALQRYANVEPIWRADPAVPGLNVNINPIIQIGRQRCR